ncbi:unnamed protein product [Heterobilharzia americana]|nr:unnamed protein product [Heterobilharzia americana]
MCQSIKHSHSGDKKIRLIAKHSSNTNNFSELKDSSSNPVKANNPNTLLFAFLEVYTEKEEPVKADHFKLTLNKELRSNKEELPNSTLFSIPSLISTTTTTTTTTIQYCHQK